MAKTITVSMDLNEYSDEQKKLKADSYSEGFRNGQKEVIDILYERGLRGALNGEGATKIQNHLSEPHNIRFDALFRALSSSASEVKE